MKPRDAKAILRCSYGTIRNYLRDGKLKLSSVSTTGRIDIDDESVYRLVGNTISPSMAGDLIFIIKKDGTRIEKVITEDDANKIIQYIILQNG